VLVAQAVRVVDLGGLSAQPSRCLAAPTGRGACGRWHGERVSVTNPWLAGPSPTRRLDRARLEERIVNLLSSQNMCVLATLGPDGPLATPVPVLPPGLHDRVHRVGSFAEDAQHRGGSPGVGRDVRAARRPGQQPRCAAVWAGPCPDRGGPRLRRLLVGGALAVRARRAVAATGEAPAWSYRGGGARSDRLHRALATPRGYAPRQFWRREPADRQHG